MSMEALRGQLQQQALAEQQAGQTTASLQICSGQVRVNGAGEASFPVTFPIKFSEKPSLSFGGEILTGDTIEQGLMPTANVIVLGWSTQDTPPYGRLYTGAQLGVVTSGVTFQKMIVHWNMIGKALTSPTY